MRLPLWLYECWYILFCALGVFIVLADKDRARHERRRIPERLMMLLGFCGGAPLMFAAMLLVRHKTRKLKFMLGMPLFTIAHALLFWWLWNAPFVEWLLSGQVTT